MPVKIHYLLGRVPDSSSWAHTFMMQSYTHQHSLYVCVCECVCVCVCVCERGAGSESYPGIISTLLQPWKFFHNPPLAAC